MAGIASSTTPANMTNLIRTHLLTKQLLTHKKGGGLTGLPKDAQTAASNH